MFSYNTEHQVVICHTCRSCIAPGRASQERHLRSHPHRLLGNELASTLELFSSYRARGLGELREYKPRIEDSCGIIEHLTCYDGFYCLQPECRYSTRHLRDVQKHVRNAHGIKASTHKQARLWKEVLLQSYFTALNMIDYFVVVKRKGDEGRGSARAGAPLTEHEKELFSSLEEDYKGAVQQIQDQAGIVQGFGDSRSERVPWLERTGFHYHLAGLQDKEIWSSYRLPLKHDFTTLAMDSTPDIPRRIISAAEEVLREAYTLCSDTSPTRKMTQQRANILNQFYSGAAGKASGFRSWKNESTLVNYFTTAKQLLLYYYRVVYCADGHFTQADPEQRLPRDIIQPTTLQAQAMGDIIQALEQTESEGAELALKRAIRQLYQALICQVIGSEPFRSPVLSFCAMLSRRVRDSGYGLWKEAGDFNSHLSALTWTAQLLIFDFVCFHKQDNEDQIPDLLASICTKYFQQLAETPFGHILQWRLYLFKVAKSAIARHQARWSLDGQSVEYRGTELKISHISSLVTVVFQEAYSLLYDELLFQAPDLAPIESWRLKDNLDLEDFGASWLTHPSNTELIRGADLALLRHIQNTPDLRAIFIDRALDNKGTGLSLQAMAIYEARVQDFLKRVLVLCQLLPGPPLREPELLSVKWRNTARQRNLLVWEKLVMIHVQYHKGQQQSGTYKDNIRFLPKALGDLLLSYIAYVLPLRQVFLRQQIPGALMSPYLWANLGGSVWADGTVSACLSKACARAKVPRLHTSNWRQLAASITKEKFSNRERANFDLEDMAQGDIDDEQELVALAEMSNHTYQTFNHAYAGTTTLTMSALLNRNYRASESWRAFFRFDQILQGKRPRGLSGALTPQVVSLSKRAKQRQGAYSEVDLLVAARKLVGNPSLQFRVPGQRKGVLAVLGPRPAEQVVLVSGTGSGKSLVFLAGTAVTDARTTLLILPTVALRGDMLRRCRQVGIRPLVWTVSSTQAAPLVIVSVEAACTESFLTYARMLARRQDLDRIVIDEAHLTITASDYRPLMLQLGWYVRQIRTQTVWLTATLPPALQEEFVERNKLVRPVIIRESTNRQNILYEVRAIDEQGNLFTEAAQLIRTAWSKTAIFNHTRDRVIVYCQTLDEVREFQEAFQCRAYTSKSGTEEEKAAIIQAWLQDVAQPVLVATSALGVGFDYPYIRLVVHIGAPSCLTEFSQASGRAGRDGQPAISLVLIHSWWKPEASGSMPPDQEAMQLYLTQQYCYRGALSQFLDQPSDWTWCVEGNSPCGFCGKCNDHPRPVGLALTLPEDEVEFDYTGPEEVLRQDMVKERALDRYERDFETMVGTCLLCRAQERRFNHAPQACPRRWSWIRAKQAAIEARQKEGRPWIEKFIVCWTCYQPQDICRVADPASEESECRFPDMVMPLCYGVFQRPGQRKWFKQHFKRVFKDEEEYMLWLGGVASLEGYRCIQANVVAALAMAEL